MRQKESELSALGERMRGASASVEDVRARLRRAGVVRERAAHLTQKERMEKELSALEESARKSDARMRGKHPTPDELEEKRRLLDGIYQARARANEIASIGAQTEKYEILKPEFVGRLPGREDFEAMLSANFELQNITHREAGLGTPTESAAARHFAKVAPPAEAEVQSVLQALSAEEEARAAKTAQKGSSKRTIATLFAVLAALLLVVGLVTTPIFIGVAVILAIVASVLFLKKDAQQETNNFVLPKACELLSRYGFSTDGNLRDRLTELLLLSRQWREWEATEQKRNKSLQSLRAQKQQLLRTLQEKFRVWDIILPPKNDYRDDIEALRRDVSRLTRAASEAEQRTRRRDAAVAEQKRLQAELTPFLRHFDPDGTMKPAECINRVTEWEAEYRRTISRIPQLREELSRFVAEKGLAAHTAEQNEILPDVDALTARERALQKDLAEMQSSQVALQSHIGRLATDVERLPEIEATVRALEEELLVARANSATVANTAQFLEEAKTGLSTRYLADMQASFSGLLQTLMDGEAPESVMDTSFKVKLRQSGKTQHPESLSQGWRDAVAFCIRLSLAEALYGEGERPPIILDDPFVNLDERRLEAAKRLLVALSNKYQILYLVCHAERR